MNDLALTASETGNLYWLIGSCFFFACITIIIVVFLRSL